MSTSECVIKLNNYPHIKRVYGPPGRGQFGAIQVYIIPEPWEPGGNDTHSTARWQQIAYGERMCWCGNPENHWRSMNDLMIDLATCEPPVRSIYASLRHYLDFDWAQPVGYTFNPFGGDSETGPHGMVREPSCVFTLDLSRDEVRYKDAECTRRVSLKVVRERRIVLDDLELVGPPIPPPIRPSLSPDLPFWKPHVELDERVRALGHRLLRDFDHQWRCILRDDYSPFMRRIFAQAVIDIATFHFRVKPCRWKQPHAYQAQRLKLPEWDPVKHDIFRLGSTRMVIAESIEDGLSMAREYLRCRGLIPRKNKGNDASHVDFIILSVKYIMLCHVTEAGNLEYTAPEPLLNGHYHVGPPSDLALDYILWSTMSVREAPKTRLRLLPVELQDMILNHLPGGPVIDAQAGCLLGIGTTRRASRWAEGSEDLTLLEMIPTEERDDPGSPDYVIGFGKRFRSSELAYGVFGNRRSACRYPIIPVCGLRRPPVQIPVAELSDDDW